MQTYQTRRKAPDRAVGPAQEAAPSKSEILHLSGAGAPQPMSPALREKFEPGFNADFSNIRISRGHIPEGMGVQAVAQGTDILLDQSAGMDVLGHELAHVVQQAQGRVEGGFPVVENAALEHEADVMGQRVASGLTAQAGPQNGFGGEMMSIAPMSSASAPAQCKIGKHKPKKDKAAAQPQAQAQAPAPAPAQPQVDEIDVQQYFPAIGALGDILEESTAARTKQQSSAEDYAIDYGLMDETDEAGNAVHINELSGGRAFGSLYREGDAMYNYHLRNLWSPKSGLNTGLSEAEMMESYAFLSDPLYHQAATTDFDSMGMDESSVRKNFLENNQLVGRLNSLGDIRVAIAGHLADKATQDPAEREKLKKEKSEAIKHMAMSRAGTNAEDVSKAGLVGRQMQRSMGITGRLDFYDSLPAEPDQGANPAYDALRKANPNARLRYPRSR